MRICKDCGGKLPEGCSDKRRFCDACIDKHKRISREREVERRRKEREFKEMNPPKTLSDLAREAKEMGMSYGQYMAWRRDRSSG